MKKFFKDILLSSPLIQIFKISKSVVFSPITKGILSIFKIYLFIISIPLFIAIVGYVFFNFINVDTKSFMDIIIAYFYSGSFLSIIAWKVHIIIIALISLVQITDYTVENL